MGVPSEFAMNSHGQLAPQNSESNNVYPPRKSLEFKVLG